MNRPARRAYTLFQLLVVLALLILLFALLLPAIAKARLSAARGQSQNNLKQIALAAHNYHDTIGHLPSGLDASNFSAATQFLPYVEQDAVYKSIDLKKSVDDKANAAIRKVSIKVFINPLDPVKEVT